ncbi:PepSY-associated TM helix domain-containing protein [Microbulbifer zhoushanensis]|uniref:PepSY-associated TM helix domain-containing protein n=1 Tax=Microbulbifer zhoushanensis TaxID=2904254 RepID=UPI001F48E0D0|nr:PepSY-associated TM helix domain-containing protein [Microbulbifer zhoushanensis]
MKLSFRPSPAFVRDMTGGHSALGLFLSTLLYIVCVSGTLAVFYPEFERWEQASAGEMLTVEADVYRRAAREALAGIPADGEQPGVIRFTAPTAEMPRMLVEVGEREHFVGGNGTLREQVTHEWTDFLVYLHFALNLPVGLGVPVVGLIGVLMAALIISGLLAHPNIVREAFSLRGRGSARRRQVDLHNRLGVWAAPFHLMIALTGAFIGLATVFAFAIAQVFYSGDVERVHHLLFRDVPEAKAEASAVPVPDFAPALASLARIAPGREPFRISLHNPGRVGQLFEITTRVPGRLVWGERFYFNADGASLGRDGWSDGSAGKQVYASSFRLHFGHYGGFAVKVAYFLLGLGMCALVVSGINIWLLRKRQWGFPRERLERIWVAQVWGVPLLIAAAALGQLVLGLPPLPVFWGGILGLSLVAAFRGSCAGWSWYLRLAVVLVAMGVVGAHLGRFGAGAIHGGALVGNLVWLLCALGFGLSCWFRDGRQRVARPGEAVSGEPAATPDTG